jgi:hypothetical protein
MVSSANTSVPATKPTCTAEVSVPTDDGASAQASCRSGMTALAANHSEVPANCENTITGSTRAGTLVVMMRRAPRRPDHLRHLRHLSHRPPPSHLKRKPSPGSS